MQLITEHTSQHRSPELTTEHQSLAHNTRAHHNIATTPQISTQLPNSPYSQHRPRIINYQCWPRAGFTLTVLPLNSPLEVVAGRLHLQKTFTFSSIYLPLSTPVVREDFTSILRLLPFPFLLLGDFNERHQLWGDTVTNSRGVMLAATFADLDLCILNSAGMTHCHGATGSFSVLDLSVCSSDKYLDFSWQVIEDLCGSDHYPIVFKTL